MGRLPTHWAGRPILDRFPYAMSGDMSLESENPATQFPQATFQNGTDKPFEIHRMIPFCTAYDAEGVALPVQPNQELMLSLVKTSIKNVDLDTMMTKTPTRLRSLCKGTSEMTWEFADPQYTIRSGGWQVDLQTEEFPVTSPFAADVTITVTMTLEGFMCIVAPPNENR